LYEISLAIFVIQTPIQRNDTHAHVGV